jgi:hypothetical protein
MKRTGRIKDVFEVCCESLFSSPIFFNFFLLVGERERELSDSRVKRVNYC